MKTEEELINDLVGFSETLAHCEDDGGKKAYLHEIYATLHTLECIWGFREPKEEN